jgi:hypothetical protein
MRLFCLCGALVFILLAGVTALSDQTLSAQLPRRKDPVLDSLDVINAFVPTRFRRKLQSETIKNAGNADVGHTLRTAELPRTVNAPASSSEVRTATGGFIYTLLVTLTVIAFLSNGAFLIYVFWLSK